MESYATFGVALEEGVTIVIIGLLILLDIFLAVIPHLWDSAISKLESQIFLHTYQLRSKNLLTTMESKDEFKMKAATLEKNKSRLTSLKWLRRFMFIFLIGSTYAKLYFFFQTYPFYNTISAYVIWVAYGLGGILHILCTGYVFHYFRFRWALRRDKNLWKNSNGEKRSYSIDGRHETRPIRTSLQLKTFIPKDHHQCIDESNGEFLFKYKGLILDEELNDLINEQDSYERKICIALVGREIQLGQLMDADEQDLDQ